MEGLPIKTVLGCLTFGLLLTVLPSSADTVLREAVLWCMAPGQKVARVAQHSIESMGRSFWDERVARQQLELDDLRQQLAEARGRERQTLFAALELKNALEEQALKPTGITEEPGKPLFALRAIEAQVLSQQIRGLWKSKQFLGVGESNGVLSDQWVLDATHVAIDQGENANVVAGAGVFAGRSIIGRIAVSGRHVSAIQLIDDPSFRSPAALGRVSARQVAFSAPGLLEGDGNGTCRLTQIPASEPVSLGDAVYSVPSDPSLEVPMLFGHVVSAKPSQPHWEITVKPDVDSRRLHKVHILTTTLNPDRLVGKR